MSEGAADPDGRSRFRTVLAAIAGIALALLTFEAAFRLLLFGSVDLDPVTHAPIATGRHRIGEGFGESHRDSSGIRLSPHACSHCPRVLVIGDSFVDAFQVNDDEAFTAVAESMLAASKPVRLLNAGAAGSSPADYLMEAASDLRRFQPAWVVIELNADDLGPDAFHADQVHFRQEGDRLTPEVPAPYTYGRITRTLASMREHSALVNYAIARLDFARNGPKEPPWFRAGFQPPAERAEAPKYPVERELSLLRSAYNDRVTFLFLPLFNAPIEDAELRFERYCRETHMSCVNFRASFDEFRRIGTAPYGFPNSRFGGGHLNAAGHVAVARQLTGEIRRLQQNGLF